MVKMMKKLSRGSVLQIFTIKGILCNLYATQVVDINLVNLVTILWSLKYFNLQIFSKNGN